MKVENSAHNFTPDPCILGVHSCAKAIFRPGLCVTVNIKPAKFHDYRTGPSKPRIPEPLESIDIPSYRKTTALKHSPIHRTNNIFRILYKESSLAEQ
jgi:hypothetical protein